MTSYTVTSGVLARSLLWASLVCLATINPFCRHASAASSEYQFVTFSDNFTTFSDSELGGIRLISRIFVDTFDRTIKFSIHFFSLDSITADTEHVYDAVLVYDKTTPLSIQDADGPDCALTSAHVLRRSDGTATYLLLSQRDTDYEKFPVQSDPAAQYITVFELEQNVDRTEGFTYRYFSKIKTVHTTNRMCTKQDIHEFLVRSGGDIISSARK
jgi:hypothetical protein